MLFKSLARDTALYGSADFVTKLVAFFTFPIIAAALSPADFGTLDIIMTTVGLAGLFVNSGLNNAVQRYYWDKDILPAERPTIVSAGFYLQTILGLLGVLITFLALPTIMSLTAPLNLSFSLYGLIAATFLMITLQATQYIQDVIRLHFSPGRFMLFSLLGRVLTSVMAVIAVLAFKAGIDGILIVQASIGLLVLPVGLYMIRQDIIPRLDRAWAKRLFGFGHPFIFAGIAYWLFGSVDRWMLAGLSSVEETGIYSVAFRFATIVLFISTAFGQAWSPYAIKVRTDHPDTYRQIYADILLVLLAGIGLIGSSIALFSGEGLSLIMPEAYHAAALPLSILCFGIIFQSTQQITGTGISLEKKTSLFMWMAWATAIFNVAGNLILIPLWGATGAAIATLFSYLLLTGGYLFFSQRLHPIPVAWGRLLAMLLLLSGLLLLSAFSIQTHISAAPVAGKILILVLAAALSFAILPIKSIKQDIRHAASS